MTTAKKTSLPSHEKLYDQMFAARTADKVTLYFRDGRAVQGSLVFNPFKGTGRVIDPDKELSIDFALDQVRDLKFH
ncbi:MAG: hypothetical protein ISQ08_02795 [Planctomycetes bacterium]|jgi:hypothetical protein|nr:hypothetical protein [Planctomycetota bacterium]MDA0947676.1 hypothetical protein [Planctomycetota bacterium]